MDNFARWDYLWVHGTIATCAKEQDLLIDGALAVQGNKIAWVGPMQELPKPPEQLANHVIDASGMCLTPGFIDCHTHFIYAGNRAQEFEWRLQGKTYVEIAQEGGGIQSTVRATRAASEDELFEQSLARAKIMLQNGVTTLEVKSGYGLNLETEVKMLRVAQRIEKLLPITIKKTFLGAHTIPAEFKNNPDDYVNLVCDEMLPFIAKEKLAEAVDVFCESIAFNLRQTEKIFKTAKQLGFSLKCHSEQLSNSESAALAARYAALSVDHLEHVSHESIRVLAEAGTVAVLLPGAYYCLRETTMPPINELRQHSIPIAIATDSNPGTSPILSLLLVMNMACTLFRLSPNEVLHGVTRHAAKALGIDATHGTLAAGKIADIAVWNVKNPRELMYFLGGNPLKQLIKAGKMVEFYA